MLRSVKYMGLSKLWGEVIGVLSMSFKILLSRACQLAGHTELDMDLSEKDGDFAMLFRDLTLHMIEGFDAIHPFDGVILGLVMSW